jgi:dolichol-phosphate mannosyltransferase
VVYAQRRRRKESLFKRTCYFLFYRLLRFLSEIPVPLDSGDFCVLDRKVVDAICSLPEKLRFIRGLRAWVGFRQTGIEYDRPTRREGLTKYTFSRLYALATDGIASSSTKALSLAQLFSALYFMLSALISGWAIAQLIFPHFSSVAPVTLITLLLIASGNCFVCLCIYILGAYIGRGYLEAKGRPTYVVMEVVEAQKSKRAQYSTQPPQTRSTLT